eukprot:CAMPEP_0113873164 /NCGR_PEP_ID=MMETSP0780_2-20120614/3617_1 /TAXON_ID=652834 /ORGANISM="Palpitomonas bilix" /LENGTH=297 /DNA_ID=CAMNT_0000858777 /DNA_START=55 /DNA_END=948 /DNA_ORIENTATION=+ /assembly_acc=CAM_ASM_000599
MSATVSSSSNVALFENGELISTDTSSEEFLKSFPRGAYSSARTVGRSAIFNLERHVSRLINAAQTIALDEGTIEHLKEYLPSNDNMRERMIKEVGASVKKYVDMYGAESELKITFLYTGWANKSTPCLYIHLAPLKAFSTSVKVQVLGKPRERAEAKDSRWVSERQQYTTKKREDVNEIILLGEGGKLPEGSETNFYVLQDGKIVTASEGILFGSVRDTVLQAAQKLDIPVEFRTPTLDTISSWEGAMISSTSRLLLPVEGIYVGDPPTLHRLESPPKLLTLKDLVVQMVKEESTAF